MAGTLTFRKRTPPGAPENVFEGHEESPYPMRDLGYAEWTETTTANNATASVTHAGTTGKSHYVTAVLGSFDGTATKLLTLSDGATVKSNHFIVNSGGYSLKRPLKITEGGDVTLALAAGGTGITGAVTLMGYTL